MKTALYVAVCARTYRQAMDDYENDPALYASRLDVYREQISDCTYRRFTTGFFYGKPDQNDQIYDSNTYVKKYIYLGTVAETDDQGKPVVMQKNKFSAGDTIEIMKPDGRDLTASVIRITGKDGTEQPSAPHPGQELHLELSEVAEPYDILRMKA